MKTIKGAFAAILLSITLVQSAMAEDEPLTDAILIELNAAKTSDGACALTFLILNGHSGPITKAVYETVLFDTSGQVDRLTLFDFGTLPPGRPRVRQFSVSGVTCDGLSQVLINGAHTCEAEALPTTACDTDLTVGTRTGIDVIG